MFCFSLQASIKDLKYFLIISPNEFQKCHSDFRVLFFLNHFICLFPALTIFIIY